MPNEENPPGFVRSKLPWLAGAAALVVFCLTLNHWVNLRSLPMTAQVAGWTWTMPTEAPLFQVVTLPIRLLPAAIQPIALNFFSALCGALTIALLARSVALLPHDRTHEQRTRERSEFSLLSTGLAWAPVVLAAGACAFQLSFWEHSTSSTGDLLNLLVFAYVIRCLLEFRISQNENWLAKLAFVYGLGITNNWALIGFFPLFLGAIIWIKGLRFFDGPFLVKIALCGVAGLLLYFLLPALWAIKKTGDVTFFDVLKLNWAHQKGFLADTPVYRNRAFLLGLTSILPVALIGIRWPSSFGDTSAAGASITNLAFRVIHLFFLAACIFVAFDPKYSPRQLGMGLPFLTFYYLGALAIGYYSGYALLVFTDPPRKNWRKESPLSKLFNPLIRFAVLIAVIAVPGALVYKNFGAIRANDGAILKEFTARTTQVLPQEPAYLLSEDPYQLALLQAALASSGKKDQYVMVDTRSLESPAYHEQMHKHYGDRWPLLGTKEEMGARIGQGDIQNMITGLASSNVVMYLHPSFGYFFERLYPEPQGQIYRLRPFTREQVLPPALTAAELQSNETFWKDAGDYIQRIEKLRKYDSPDAHYVAQYYSRALNAWGVDLQRSGKLDEAGKDFAEAFRLNTNNVPAKYNALANKALKTGDLSNYATSSNLEDRFGIYRSWDTLLSDNGPFDHPEFCQTFGDLLLERFHYRQAAVQFTRVIQMEPTNYLARISYAKTLVYGRWIDKGLAEADNIEHDFPNLPLSHRLELTSLRAAGEYSLNHFDKAEQLLKVARAMHPDQPTLSQALFELYRTAGRYTNAIEIVDQQLVKNPTNTVMLLQKAELELNSEHFLDAHSTLDRILAVTPQNTQALLYHVFAYIQEKSYDAALTTLEKVIHNDPENAQALTYRGIVYMEKNQLDKARESFDAVLSRKADDVAALRNRAILNLRAHHWVEAKDDYKHLLLLTPRSHAVFYGLAEVAYNDKDYREAERLYKAYLKYAPAQGTTELQEEKKKVEERLKTIQTAQK